MQGVDGSSHREPRVRLLLLRLVLDRRHGTQIRDECVEVLWCQLTRRIPDHLVHRLGRRITVGQLPGQEEVLQLVVAP